MKSSKGFCAGLIVMLVTVLVGLSVKSGIARQATGIQSVNAENSPAKNDDLKRLSAPELKPMVSSNSAASRSFEPAASRNAQLQFGLNWAFGGKQQRGWQIYAPLIAGLIDADADGASSEFAMQLSRWQQGKGIESDGILDSSTWSQMVSTWQSQRIKSSTYPSDDQLVQIPTSDCYDPSRPAELRRAERATYAAYKRMVAAAAEELGLETTATGELAAGEKYLKIISAFRSREYQAHLRAQSPNSGRAGLAVNSPHFTGRALDIYVGGEPVSTKDDNRMIQTQTRAYRWLAKNASRFGFRPYFYEPWHWEYVGK
jgi:zinc D-Ala-D-Ala carboxypeptidase